MLAQRAVKRRAACNRALQKDVRAHANFQPSGGAHGFVQQIIVELESSALRIIGSQSTAPSLGCGILQAGVV